MSKYVVTFTCVIFMVFIFIYPKEIIYSIKEGLLLWYNSVLPSVFPFLIASNILISIGAISKLGRMLTPIMQPLFRVPGGGAFALVMGGISGYPVGAKIVADLRDTKKVSRDEGQRLISVCNNAGPVFITGAVGTAILGSAEAGYFILATNCISIIIVGLLFRFYRSRKEKDREYITHKRRRDEVQSFGRVLAAAVTNSIETILQIGGFILLFGAVITIFRLSGVLECLANILKPAFRFVGMDTALCLPFVSGVFEITNGIKMMGELSVDLRQKVILSGMLVSFGGLSIYAQTASFISKTDICPRLYLASKILQSVIQVLIALCLYNFVF